MQIYLVGGAVRDQLLGCEVRERDWVVVGATSAEMLALGYEKVGKDFPVFLHPQTHEEYALARTERKTAQGYYGFSTTADSSITLEQDLQRRDLTINAIAQDQQGNLIDPYGGVADLQNRVLRHVSPAFVEDPLRLLRVARFAARLRSFGFKIAPETAVLLREISRSGELTALSRERVWLEWQKILNVEHAAFGIQILREVGALQPLFAELDACFGVPQDPSCFALVDTGLIALNTLAHACQHNLSMPARLAGLWLLIGCARTPPSSWPLHPQAAEFGMRALQQFKKIYSFSNENYQLCILTLQFHAIAHTLNLTAENAEQIAACLQQMDAFRRPERFLQCLEVYRAHANSAYKSAVKEQRLAHLQRLQLAWQAAAAVQLDSALFTNLTAEQIKSLIAKERAAAILQVVSSF